MNQNQRSLALGMITGILITFLVLLGGAMISQQLSTIELKLDATKSADVAIGVTHLTLVYHPDEAKVTDDMMQSGGFPATVGYSYVARGGLHGEIGCIFTVTQVNSDYVVLIIRPSIFTIEYLFRPSITVTDSHAISGSVLP